MLVAAVLQQVSAIDLDPDSSDSIYNAAATIAQGIFGYYENAHVGNGTKKWQVGLFPYPPYFWWQSGATWGAMVDYCAYTGDATYLNWTLDALAAQAGPKHDFIMPQQAGNEVGFVHVQCRKMPLATGALNQRQGNDDQQWWIYAILSALEHGMPALPCPVDEESPDCSTAYLTIATKAFNEFVRRWHADSKTCHGGLRWQYNASHSGYNYKNSITNGGFFQIAARLARYTADPNYASWADRIWTWERSIGLLDKNYHVFDGASTDSNCKQLNRDLWGYNAGVWTYGAAVMYNYTGGAAPWGARLKGLVAASEKAFFTPFTNSTNIMYETRCEVQGTCNTDQQSFKAYLSRFLGKSAIIAPLVQEKINSLMKSTAVGAAKSCSGGHDNKTCGSRWYAKGYDGNTGLGEEPSAFEAIQSLLAK